MMHLVAFLKTGPTCHHHGTWRDPESDILTPTVFPGTWEQFVRSVVPELQRRGVFREEYRGRTLRENLRD